MLQNEAIVVRESIATLKASVNADIVEHDDQQDDSMEPAVNRRQGS